MSEARFRIRNARGQYASDSCGKVPAADAMATAERELAEYYAANMAKEYPEEGWRVVSSAGSAAAWPRNSPASTGGR